MTSFTITLSRSEALALLVAFLLIVCVLSAWVVAVDRRDTRLMQEYDDHQADQSCRVNGKGRALILPGPPRQYICSSGAVL